MGVVNPILLVSSEQVFTHRLQRLPYVTNTPPEETKLLIKSAPAAFEKRFGFSIAELVRRLNRLWFNAKELGA